MSGPAAAEPTPVAGMAVPARTALLTEAFVGRLWVLERMVAWLDGGTERWFLLKGAPGHGKSSLAAWLAGAGPPPADDTARAMLDRARASSTAVHFCAARQGGSPSADSFVTALSERLATISPVCAAAAERLLGLGPVNVNQTIGQNLGSAIALQLVVKAESAARRFELGVREPLKALLAAEPDRQVIILIDGLDESLGESPGIVELLASAADLPDAVRFLVTTRPDDRVTDKLSDALGPPRVVDLSSPAEAEHVQADVRALVRARLSGDGEPDPALVEALVERSEGSFLYIDFALKSVGPGAIAGGTDAIPRGLAQLYRSYLARLLAAAEGDTAWSDKFKPVLGSLSVAAPSAPVLALPGWLDWPADMVGRVIDQVEQVTAWHEEDGGGWTVFHRSLADFLNSAHYQDDENRNQLNDYYVSPLEQSERIVHHYRAALAERWGNDWTNCDDSYCLRQYARHLCDGLATASPADAGARVAELCATVGNAGFQAAQLRVLGSVEPTLAAARLAVAAAVAHGAGGEAAKLAESLASAGDIPLRGMAVESLVSLHRADPAEALAAIDRLVGADDMNASAVALKSAYLIGAPAMAVFRRVAADPRPELRQAATFLLYLRWQPGPDNPTTMLMTELANQVELRDRILRKPTALALDFLVGLSFTIYVNHCDEPAVVQQTSDLWRTVLKDKLHLDVINKPALDRLVRPVITHVYSRRVLETALLSDLQDAKAVFAAPQDARNRFSRVVPLVDPSADVRPHTDDLAALLAGDQVLGRVLGCIVVAVHAAADPADEEFVKALFDQLPPLGRQWLVRSFCVRFTSAPPSWVALVDGLARRFVAECRDAFMAPTAGTTGSFDIDFLALGLACKRAGVPMALVEELLGSAVRDRDTAMAVRCVQALAAVGVYHPDGALATLHSALPSLRRSALGELEDSLVATLATIRVVHPDAVDVFLRVGGAPDDLGQNVSLRADTALLQRTIWWIGFYNHAVYESLHFPWMRRDLLTVQLQALAEARSARDFFRRAAPGPLRMLREADYALVEWTTRP